MHVVRERNTTVYRENEPSANEKRKTGNNPVKSAN